MNERLAVFAPQIGTPSETFVERHVNALAPGRTVVVSGAIADSLWSANCPALLLANIPKWSPQKFIPYFSKFIGLHLPMACRTIERFLKQNRTTVILAEYLDFGWSWLSLARKMGIRFFAHGHGYDVSYSLLFPKWRKRYLHYNESDGVIVVSHYSRNRLIQLGMNPSRIHVVPCSIDVASQPVPGEYPDGKVRCIAVGRMVTKKGPLLTLGAFAKAAETVQNLHLDFVGDGPLLKPCKDLCRKLNVCDKVTFHGSQPNRVVHQLLNNSNIFIQHSIVDPSNGDEEGLPVAILEAMAHGLPVIATRHAGIPEAVQDGITGLLVEERDYSAMADHLIMLSRQTDIRVQMGQTGWESARRLFSWEHEREELRRILAL